MKPDEKTIEIIYNIYKNLEKGESNSAYAARLSRLVDYTDIRTFRLFSSVLDTLGYNLAPAVISNDEYKSLSSTELYRGSASPEAVASLLVDFDYHKGDGYHGSGIYSTPNRDLASEYAAGRNSLLKFKLSPDSKLFDHTLLDSVVAAFYFSIYDYANSGLSIDKYIEKNQQKLLGYFSNNEVKENAKALLKSLSPYVDALKAGFVLDLISNPPTLAALIGIDAIENPRHENSVIILNRSKMTVSEKEFKRIANSTRLYRGGHFNTADKPEDAFLRE